MDDSFPTTDQIRSLWISEGECAPGDGARDSIDLEAGFERWLDRLKAEAGREALTRYAHHIDEKASALIGVPVSSEKASQVRDYCDLQYPLGE